ncbi:MAG: hypothetical protein IPQ07_33045 [Myxococcales bacterium]|nr:hypothetical protein [Myxococcales bacterium]
MGEYIGLARLGERGALHGGEHDRSARAPVRGREHDPFMRAATFRNAYQTDLWQTLIDFASGSIRS